MTYFLRLKAEAEVVFGPASCNAYPMCSVDRNWPRANKGFKGFNIRLGYLEWKP